jgi:hypothetical protein
VVPPRNGFSGEACPAGRRLIARPTDRGRFYSSGRAQGRTCKLRLYSVLCSFSRSLCSCVESILILYVRGGQFEIGTYLPGWTRAWARLAAVP